MPGPKVYADFQNLDELHRLRLTSRGTLLDLERQGIQLCDGLRLTVYTDDEDDEGRPSELQADAVVQFDREGANWVATIDWLALCHAEAADGLVESPIVLAPDHQFSRELRQH